MCGRFSLHLTDLTRIGSDLGPLRSGIDHWEPRYNIAPSQHAPVVIQRQERMLVLMSWGFVPHFKKSLTGPRPINARSETAADKALFRDALHSRRCVVPATGYFEWPKAAPGKRGQGPKQPYWIHPQAGGLLYMAGLWSTWRPPAGGDLLSTFAILTREAAGPPRAIHDRMPLSLTTEDAGAWLAPGAAPGGWLPQLARRAEAGEDLQVDPVNPKVNHADFDDPSCIEAAPPPRQLGLF